MKARITLVVVAVVVALAMPKKVKEPEVVAVKAVPVLTELEVAIAYKDALMDEEVALHWRCYPQQPKPGFVQPDKCGTLDAHTFLRMRQEDVVSDLEEGKTPKPLPFDGKTLAALEMELNEAGKTFRMRKDPEAYAKARTAYRGAMSWSQTSQFNK